MLLRLEPILGRLHGKLTCIRPADPCSRSSRIDMVKLEGAQRLDIHPRLDTASKHSIMGAHAEEVVRAIFIDDVVCSKTVPSSAPLT